MEGIPELLKKRSKIEYGIFFSKSEVFIESEKLYEVLYIFEMEVKTNGKYGKV